MPIELLCHVHAQKTLLACECHYLDSCYTLRDYNDKRGKSALGGG